MQNFTIDNNLKYISPHQEYYVDQDNTGDFINFLNPSFTYKGVTYGINVAIFKNNGGDDQINSEDISHFDSTEIIECKIRNNIESFLIEGELVIEDKIGKVDKYIGNLFTYVTVCFGVTNQKGEFDDKQQFKHVFMVDNMYIEQRKANSIIYRLILTDTNKFRTECTIEYTNYDSEEESQDRNIDKIIQQLFDQSGLSLDSKSIENKMQVKLPYITSNQDTIVSSLRYILSRYISLMDEELDKKDLFVLCYNMKRDKYFFLDISDYKQQEYSIDEDVDDSERGVLISINPNDRTEGFVQKDKVEIGFKENLNRLQVLKKLFNKGMYCYDYDRGKMTLYSAKSKQIIDILNKTRYNNGSKLIEEQKILQPLKTKIYIPKQYDSKQKDGDISTIDTYSDSDYDFSIYYDLIDIILNFNTFAINTDGNVNRDVGMPFEVQMDISDDDELANRYDNFKGHWIIQGITHIIRPRMKEYRNNIILFRNWRNKEG